MNKALLPLALALLCNACPPQDHASPPPTVSVSEPAPAASTATPQPGQSGRPVGPTPAAGVVLEVGKGIGPVRLGMTLGELSTLGLAIEEGSYDLRVGPYRLLMDGGAVSFIEIELAKLPDGLSIDGRQVSPDEQDIEQIAKLLPGCGELDIRLGGNVIECADGTVTVAAAGPPGIVQLQLLTASHARKLRPAEPTQSVPRPSASAPCSGGGPCGS